MEFAKKGKWKENDRFWRSAEFAKKRKMQEKIKINVQKRKIQGIEFARNEICKEWKLQKNEICT